jgi:hypothetical protein
MSIDLKVVGKRVYHLVKAVREMSSILPGERVLMTGERPATYVGAIEVGDEQFDYLQMHAFRLHDGLHVVLAVQSLNRRLSRLLY